MIGEELLTLFCGILEMLGDGMRITSLGPKKQWCDEDGKMATDLVGMARNG
jgi:hypothetical protein